jgi:hypothetical protein
MWLVAAGTAALALAGTTWLLFRCESKEDEFWLHGRLGFRAVSNVDGVWLDVGLNIYPPPPGPTPLSTGFEHNVYPPSPAPEIWSDQEHPGLLFRAQKRGFGFACWKPTRNSVFTDLGFVLVAPHRWLIVIFLLMTAGSVRIYVHCVLAESRKVAGRICVHCGYDLRASTAECPECGRFPRRK